MGPTPRAQPRPLWSSLFLAVAVWLAGSPRAPALSYEAYWRFLGNHPDYSHAPGFRVNTQGVAHDQSNWYITQADYLWKIPVTIDLASISAATPGVTRLGFSDVAALRDAGFNHFGDPDCYEYGGEDYLLVPLERGAATPAIAVFKTSSMAYLGFAALVDTSDGGWCAVDRDGVLWAPATTTNFTSTVKGYTLNWSRLKRVSVLEMTPSGQEITLKDELGSTLDLYSVQGGEFAPGGDLFYLANGFIVGDSLISCHSGNDIDPDWMMAHGGIHVFDVHSWRRVRKSDNSSGAFFAYQFDPSYDDCEEPEGLTIWDLDDGRAPGVRGQLHVLIVDNDWPDDDEVELKHYTNVVHVDAAASGGNGTISNPYQTVRQAYGLIVNNSWTFAKMKIKAGTYPEPLGISWPVQLLSTGGTAVLGTTRQVSVSPSGAIDLGNHTGLRTY